MTVPTLGHVVPVFLLLARQNPNTESDTSTRQRQACLYSVTAGLTRSFVPTQQGWPEFSVYPNRITLTKKIDLMPTLKPIEF